LIDDSQVAEYGELSEHDGPRGVPAGRGHSDAAPQVKRSLITPAEDWSMRVRRPKNNAWEASTKKVSDPQ